MKLFAATLCVLLTACGGGGASALPTAPLPNTPSAPNPAPRGTLTIAVVGDSISRYHIDPGPAPCGPVLGGPACGAFVTTDNYPTFVGSALGATVVNLSIPGARTVTSPNGIPDILSEVPGIPTGADIVLFEGGTNDLPSYALDRIDTVVSAIQKQAPKARIIFVGVRYYASSTPSRVDEWDSHEASLGTFVDLRWLTDVADFPDGTHPSITGVQKIAAAVLAKI